MVVEVLDEEAIFKVAVEIPTEDARSTYLQQVCGNDRALLDRVLALLRVSSEAKDFLESPPAAFAATAPMPAFTATPGAQFGHYEIREQIGEGGMGVVYAAEQTAPVRRRVALKIIKPGMDSRDVVARFEAERQALAMMDHPNIAKVYDAGATENGRPYFVMELVKGVAITDYCDQCNLTTHDRLELFITVCQAVQHAHEKGVIHRDLKPTNILVAMQDGLAAPKIIDFGVAKAVDQQLTERTLMTAFAQIVGTPLYMSPEQAELSPLGVDTRSDIYALGVLLYELLTGTTPFDKDRLHAATYDELRRIIREEDPPRPSARISTLAADLATTVAERRRTDSRRLRQTFCGDLDWIVMKCLEKDRNRRYDSAGSLAREIERYLHDEPVQARPPSVTYRAAKFVRRNKVIALAVSAIFVALTTATGLSTWLYMREREARRQAEIGYKIDNVANPFHNNSPEAADEALATLAPDIDQMNLQNRARLYYAIGDIRGRQGNWNESAENFENGVNLESNRPSFEPYHYYLPVLVQCGALEKYQRVRSEVIERFGTTTDPRIAECILKDCLITPWPDAKFDVLERLADTALNARNHWAQHYFQFAKGLLEYRRGNYELAAQSAQRANSERDYQLGIQVFMLQAMCHQQRGETEKARSVLKSGLEYAHAKKMRTAAELFPERLWNDWIIGHALIDEATTLIDNKRAANEVTPVSRSDNDVK